jgi:hypothetical protein
LQSFISEQKQYLKGIGKKQVTNQLLTTKTSLFFEKRRVLPTIEKFDNNKL